jgi:hypothetical protein
MLSIRDELSVNRRVRMEEKKEHDTTARSKALTSCNYVRLCTPVYC